MLKVIAISTSLAFLLGIGSGWYAKGRDVKADQAELLETSLKDFEILAQGALNTLQIAWELQAQENYEQLSQIGLLRTEDAAHEAEMLKQMRDNNRELQRIKEQVSLGKNMGSCQLTPDFVSMWNQARAASSRNGITKAER